MATKIKTMDDYQKATIKAKQAYQNAKMSYNWNYTFIEESHETFMYFMITNNHQATKILFDTENNIIIEKDMYTMDVRKMLELQEKLNG